MHNQRSTRHRVAAIETLEGRTLLAASLVADLNPDPASPMTETATARVGGNTFFTLHSGAGSELWKSDGTPKGTRLVRDINPGVASSDPDRLVALDDEVLLFTASDAAGRGLWRTDGTRKGTVLVKRIRDGGVQSAIAHNGLVYFSVNRGGDDVNEARDSLWITDGTGKGTRVLLESKDLDIQDGFLVYGRHVLFVVEQESNGRVLWRTKGSAKSTRAMEHVGAHSLWIGSDIRVLGKHLIYNNSRSQTHDLWGANFKRTWPVADIAPGWGGHAENLTVIGDKVYFSGDDGVHGEEPWVSDGTAGGTFMLKDLVTARNRVSSHPNDFRAHEGVVYFNAYDDEGERTLYRTDGTPDGTALIGPLGTARRPGRLQTHPLFVGEDADGVLQIWRAETPEAEPVQVTQFTADGSAFMHGRLARLDDGRLLFIAYDADAGDAVWVSDGTDEGTRRLRRIAGRTDGSDPSGLGSGHDGFYFGRRDQYWSFGRPPMGVGSLWKIRDGNEPEKVAVLDGSVDQIIPAGDGLTYFTVRQHYTDWGIAAPLSHYYLWRTDGTAEGTYKLFDQSILVTLYGSSRPALGMLDGRLYAAFDGALWKIGDTPEGHERVMDAMAEELIVQGDRLFLLDREEDRLLVSDGTADGSSVLVDYGGDHARYLNEVVGAGGRVYFSVSGYDEEPDELWTADGTADGTLMLKRFQAPGSRLGYRLWAGGDGMLFFDANNGEHGSELWRSDGTRKATRLVKDIRKRDAGASPDVLASVGKMTYFLADDGVHGRELWRTDGTPKGTALVADIRPGRDSASIYSAAAVGENLVFSADDGVHGREPWILRPGEAPALLADVFVGRAGSDPEEFTGHGRLLYFSADDYLHGRELWSTPL